MRGAVAERPTGGSLPGQMTLGMLMLAASPVTAQSYACVLEDGTEVAFVIDRNQFIDAVVPEEPIRRKVTLVQAGAARFPAEPFLLGDRSGFHAEGLGGASVMFVVAPDGAATWANVTTGERRPGRCEVQ